MNIPVPLFALDADDEHLPAHIQSVNNDIVQFRITSRLSSGRRLVMQYKGCRTELKVVTCREKEAGVYYVDCQMTSSREGSVRDDWRMTVNWPAQVEVPPSKSAHQARIRDISVFGLGIQIDFQPEIDSLLIVHMRSGVGFGRVRHYREVAPHCYWVGLYLEEFRSSNGERRDFQRLGRLLRRLVHSVTGTVTRSKQTE